jgi:hypothetical protein
MVVFDGEANGYRNHVLPLAASDSTVQRAIFVATAFHLAPKMPELLAPAEGGREAIIQKLLASSQTDDPSGIFNETTWVTILLLIVGDLVAGHGDVLLLYQMLRSFLRVRRHQEKSFPLTEFLTYQSKL